MAMSRRPREISRVVAGNPECPMALEGLNGYDLLAITSHQLVGILRTYRDTFAGSPERGKQFDALCNGLMDWLELEIALLRFARMP
jgi:hypothetical protein